MDNVEREMTLAEEYNQQGRVLYSLDKYEESIKEYQKAEKEDPMLIQTYLNLSESYIMLDQYDDAKKALKRAQLVDKSNGEVYFHFGNIALLEDNIEEAKQNFAKSISFGYKNPYIYLNLGTTYEEMGELDEAMLNYNKAIQMDKYFDSAWLKKLELLLSLEQYSEGLSVCEDMIDLLPDRFEGYHYKIAILMELGKQAEAKAALDHALDLYPDDPGFKMDKVHYLASTGKYEEAEKLLDRDFSNDPDAEDYAKLKVQLMLQQEKTEEAVELAEKSLDEKFDEELNFLLTNIYMAGEQYAQAIASTERTLKENNESLYYYSALYFNALAHKKNGEDATEYFANANKKFRMACSGNPGVIDLYIYRALCYKELKNYDRAYEMVDYILAINENAPEALLIRSEINKDLGKMAEYEADRKEALKQNPNLERIIM